MYDLDLERRVRAWCEPRGYIVLVVDGWESRGSVNFNPKGSVDHHTAGPLRGDNPSLGVCINGRPGLAGPLCNIYISRSNIIYIVAAGRANHAGRGGWLGSSGNSSMYAVERENVGYAHIEPWRPDQDECAAVVHAALAEGHFAARMVCEHKEWAPTRKIDAHTIEGDYMRAKVEYILGHPVLKPPEGDWFDMRTDEEIKSLMREVVTEVTHGQVIRFIIGDGNASDPDPRKRFWYIEAAGIPIGPFDEAYCRSWAAQRAVNFDQSKEVIDQFMFDSYVDKFVRSQDQFSGPRGKDAILVQPKDRALTEPPGSKPR